MEYLIKGVPQHMLVKIIWPLMVLSFLVLWVFMQSNLQKGSVQFFKPEYFTAESSLFSSLYYLVNTEGCRIQMMNAFDESILQFLVDKRNVSGTKDDERPIRCSPSDLPPLVSSNLTHLFIDENSVAMHNLTELYCCYQPFWRKLFQNISAKVGQIDNHFEYDDECTGFQSAVFMEDIEFVKVQCISLNRSDIVYTDFHAFTPLKKDRSKSSKSDSNKINVLVLGVDAVSRLNLIRQMPKTVDYIKNELKGIEMLGYNKVADNTFPNLVPALTGLSVDELKKSCWPTIDSYFDPCPFLWKNFSEAGYTTCFAEDSTWMGVFNYVKQGFFDQPTDYYWGMYNKRAENEIGKDKRLNANLCIGYRLTLSTLFEYGQRFIHTMKKKPFFSFIWGTSLSHDFLNLPMYGDDLHKEFLSNLQENDVFKNTVLVFMSDHGIRWGGIRSTPQGYLEERLPFLYLVFPSRFRKRYTSAVGNLRINARKLTTPFDLHETLGDLLRLDNLNRRSLKERIANGENKRRGISLFLPISNRRTCRDAGIPENWCTCHQVNNISVNDTAVVEAAKALVDSINDLLKRESQCARLVVKRILSARVGRVGEQNDSTAQVKDYIITIETEPGEAHFEATVRYNTDGTFKTIGTVSRTNTYGNQSVCILNYKLRLYCFCL